MKIILLGTPFFSVPTFEEIIKNFEVVAVISQPDRQSGRKMSITATPVKSLAEKYHIPVYQPEKIIEIYNELSKLDFDLMLTMAYGQIIPEKILKLAKIASLNIHGSLLPKYRGAAPVQRAIMNGEKQTGISLMYMEKEMDSGAILFQEKLDIEDNDTADILFSKMCKLTRGVIVEWLKKVETKDFKAQKQDPKKVSFAPKISKEEEQIKWDTIQNNKNKINGLSSNPGAFYKDGDTNKRIKIYEVSLENVPNSKVIPCSDGNLYATTFQIEGKNKVKVN